MTAANHPAPGMMTQTLTELGGRLIETPENTIMQRLAERRINEQTIASHDIKQNGNGWIYPTPGGGHRWKAATPGAAIKYFWTDITGQPGSKTESDNLYFTDDLQAAITAAGGVAWYVSGEADRWAMYSAGIKHVLSGYSESMVPAELIPALQAAGVITVYIAPDLDDTGRAWAGKVATALQGSGIELDCRTLPADLGDKADLGRAWQQYTGRLPFERYLVGLTRWQPTITTPNVPRLATAGDTVPAEYKELIAARLGVEDGYKANGWSANVRCPFHAEENPSATLNETSGLYCHAEGKFYLWNDLGRLFGLGTVNQWLAANVDNMLATEARECLIRDGYSKLARLIDALYLYGLRGGDTYTRKQACKLLDGVITPKSIRQTLENIPPEEMPFFFPITFNSVIRPKKGIYSSCKPAIAYRQPTPQEVASVYKLDLQHFDVMPADKLKSIADYRAEVEAARPRRNPGQYSRRELSRPIGVSRQTSLNYDKRANLKVTPVEPARQTLTPELIATLPENQPEKIKGLRWIETPTGKRYPAERGAAAAALFRMAEAGEPTNNNPLTLCTRQANYYEPGPE